MATPRSSKPRETRQPLPLPIGGGLFTAGDYARTPPGTSPKMKNCLVRPGPRVEMRPSWLRDSTIDGTMWPNTLFAYESDTSQVVLFSAGGQLGFSAYRKGDGTYGLLSTVFGASDAANFLNKLYLTYITGSATIGSVDSFNGSAVTINAINAKLAGSTIAAFNHRMYLGGIAEAPVNEVVSTAAYKFEDGAVWVLAGGPPTVAASGEIRTLTIVGATDTLKTANPVYTTGATEEYIQVSVDLRAGSNSATDIPITITVENAAGAVVYGRLEVLAINRTIQPDWQRFVFPSAVRLPAATAVYVKYAAGTSTITAVTGSLDVADKNNARGLAVTKGRRTYNSVAVGSALTSAGLTYPYRFVWCEVDDPTYWRATSYYDCKEVAGAITVIREGNGQLHVFKADGIWSFNPQDNANLPIAFANLIRNIGCISPQAIEFFENTFYFIGRNEIYSWAGSGEPQAIAGSRMRELLFPSTATPILAIDQENREVWVHTTPGAIYVYNITTDTWSGPITVTGADDAALAVGDLLYTQPQGETRREMWAALNVDSYQIVKLRASQTQDNITGTARDVVAEYWFRPIQTLDPKQAVILESVEIDHKVTADQTGSTTTAEISFDGGTTFSKAVDVTLAPLASGNYQPMRLDLWQSDERLLVAIKHTGLAGPQYFNISGGSATVQVCGDSIRSNPTTTGSTL